MSDESNVNPDETTPTGEPEATAPQSAALQPAAPQSAAPEAPAVPEPAAPPQWPSQPTPGYAAAPVYAPAPETSSNAIIALILSIVSWAVCPIVPAIVALILANMATKEIAASGGRKSGEGLVTAAKIVSWVNIGLWAALFVVGMFVVVLAAVSGAMR